MGISRIVGACIGSPYRLKKPDLIRKIRGFFVFFCTLFKAQDGHVLINAGADLAARNKKGFTPLDMATADNNGWGRGRRPVINVSWDDAVAYTKWLSEQTSKRYRLPSEAEWEYAARAGTTTKYSWGKKIGRNRANCDGCGSQWDNKKTGPVGSFPANAWGLHDMHGNVWEWVQDCWNDSYRGAPTDGSAWEGGDCSRRVMRGCSWSFSPGFLRATNRGLFTTGDRGVSIGFRIARTLTP